MLCELAGRLGGIDSRAHNGAVAFARSIKNCVLLYMYENLFNARVCIDIYLI